MDKKRALILILLGGIILSLFLPLTSEAATEAEYPEIPGTETPEGDSVSKWISYLFNFALLAGTLIAGATLIYGGFLYLTSRGSPSKINEAKSRLFHAFFGLLLVFGSYLILSTISPDLVSFDLEDINPFGTSEKPTTTPSIVEAKEYQEIPVGTLVEKILGKNIGCYKDNDVNNEMIDCQDKKKVEIGPVNKYDVRKGYCYDFDEEGNFKDANPDTDQIDPMTEHDRLDCITKFQEPVNMRMEKLKKWAEKIEELTSQCSTKNCKVDGECIDGTCADPSCKEGTCQPLESCIGKPYESGKDPCLSREQIDEYRKKIRRNYKDEELKKITVDKFMELAADIPEEHGDKTVLVADQVRYMMVNFLKPLEKDLENDLKSLRKAENKLKNESPYWSVLTHSQFLAIRDKKKPEEAKIKKFHESNTGQEVEITKHCLEFNCKNCKKEDEDGELKKLPCDECNLDQLERGECTSTRYEDVKTCKCEEYLLNNEKGEDYELEEGCTTTDEECKICKIENEYTEDEEDKEEKECYLFNDNPATFYYPMVEESFQRKEARAATFECRVEPFPEETYPGGLIPIGEVVDQSEKFGQLILNELKTINKSINTAVNAVFNPYLPDKKEAQHCKIHFLPEGCMCHNNPDAIWGITHCSKELKNTSCPCCHEHEECSGTGEDRECHDVCDAWACECGTCYCDNWPHPCPMNAPSQCNINYRLNQIKTLRQKIIDSFDRIEDLAWERNLREDDPVRTEMINMLEKSKDTMEHCISGYHTALGTEAARNRVMSCSVALDLMQLEEVTISPEFPIPDYTNCYPFNSEELSSSQRQKCLEAKESDRCLNAIQDYMNNYFCCER